MTTAATGTRDAVSVDAVRAPATFDLRGRRAVITGGAGLLGRQHAAALSEAGAEVVLLDLDRGGVESAAGEIGERCSGVACDITDDNRLRAVADEIGSVDILINNAARNPKVEDGGKNLSRLENFPLSEWDRDLDVGLKGAFLCARAFGEGMARRGRGVILNVASDLGVIAPDQRLYRVEGAADNEQPVKPVTYSVAKFGLIGLTVYLATYWADKGVRVNAISPAGVANGQPAGFVERLASRIPMGRMCRAEELRGAVLFLCSDASSYMTGHNLVLDGGRSIW
ncbi:MAG: SDR family oxidoreductase [Planctomycetota bacterium]